MPGGVRAEHPGALTDSDLLSWNWSSHGDSSLADSASLPNEYCEIIKQISEADYDSGKDSDILPEKVQFVEVCEEEKYQFIKFKTKTVTISCMYISKGCCFSQLVRSLQDYGIFNQKEKLFNSKSWIRKVLFVS